MQARLVLGSLAPLIGLLSTSPGRADFTICNATSQGVFLMSMAPDGACPSGLQYDLSLGSPGSCTPIYGGDATGRAVYFHAWTNDADELPAWRGPDALWLPDDREWCVPLRASCSPGATRCADHSKYGFHTSISPKPNAQLELRADGSIVGSTW